MENQSKEIDLLYLGIAIFFISGFFFLWKGNSGILFWPSVFVPFSGILLASLAVVMEGRKK